jgi:hypothetical protein
VERRHPSHTVMRDPAGNEFCVKPGPAGRTAQPGDGAYQLVGIGMPSL